MVRADLRTMHGSAWIPFTARFLQRRPNAGFLRRSLRPMGQGICDQFYRELRVPGGPEMNSELEKAGRVADYLEVGELMCYDALTREESCGAHFREEYQTSDGEALRNDKDFSFTSAWEWAGTGKEPILHKEPLHFDFVTPSVRSYK